VVKVRVRVRVSALDLRGTPHTEGEQHPKEGLAVVWTHTAEREREGGREREGERGIMIVDTCEACYRIAHQLCSSSSKIEIQPPILSITPNKLSTPDRCQHKPTSARYLLVVEP
jgi:hypothetical protein